MRCRTSIILAMLLVLSACASAPTKQFVHINPEAESKIGKISHLDIVADVCLFRDVLGDNDYWVVQESRSAAAHMLEAAKTFMLGKGYEVSYAQAPFVGAFKDDKNPFKVCDASGAEVREKIPPLFEAENLANNPAYREALLKIIPTIPSQANNSSRQAICCSDGEMRDQMSIIAKNTGGDATLFLIGHGKIVSSGKQITQGVATGLITAALTLGMVSVYRYDASFMDTYAVLVDNNTGERLWSNSMRLKGDGFADNSNAYYDSEKWPKNILYYIPAKTEEKKNNGSELVNNENKSSQKTQ